MVKNSGQAKIGLLLIAIVFAVLVVFAFTKKADTEKKKDNFTGVSKTATNSSQNSENGDIESEKLANNYFIFKKESYESTITYKLPVFLFFYKNTCSECEKQESVIVETFNNLAKSSVIGFRVNYEDNEASQEEKELAKKFAVKEDLVMIILDSNGKQQNNFTTRTDKEILTAALNKVNTIR